MSASSTLISLPPLSSKLEDSYFRLSTTPDFIIHSHLANKPILIDTLPLPTLWLLRPHLLDILKYHVAVSIEGFHPREQLAVIPARDQDLGVRAGGSLKYG